MPFYQQIDAATTQGKRTLENLLVLRHALDENVPRKQMESNLLLATWNIREFGSDKYGGRSLEALYYIAEIVNRFDLIAILHGFPGRRMSAIRTTGSQSEPITVVSLRNCDRPFQTA